MSVPPRLWDRLDLLERVVGQRPLGLFTDVDGTLSEITPAYGEATVSPRIVGRLERLCSVLPAVVAVSGRRAVEARDMVGVEGMVYYGNHGLERWEKGEVWTSLEQPDEVRGLVSEVARGLSREVAGHPGVSIEDKGHSLTVHYRRAPDPEEVGERVLSAAQGWAGPRGLAVRRGRMVVEVRPAGVSKGSAVGESVRRLGLRAAIAVGDDDTDADAFDMVHGLAAEGDFIGLAVAVRSAETPRRLLESADATVDGVGGVERLLGWLEERLSG